MGTVVAHVLHLELLTAVALLLLVIQLRTTPHQRSAANNDQVGAMHRVNLLFHAWDRPSCA